MQTTNPSPLDTDLPREPKNQLDFLMLVGFFRWFDVPFLLGIFVVPIGLYAWTYFEQDPLRPLLLCIFLYQIWMCILIYRTMHFVVKCIGSVKNTTFDAARLAASYLSGGKS